MDPSEIPLIPRRLLFGNPTRSSCQISGDGRRLSWLAPLDGVMNVWVAPASAVGDPRPVTRAKGRGIPFQRWAHDARHLLYGQDTAGDENWHLYAVDPAGGESRDLTPVAGVAARLVRASRERPDELVVGLNDRDRRWHDLWHVRISTGERKLIRQNTDQIGSFVLDHQFNLRLASRARPDGGRTILRAVGDKFEEIITVPLEDAAATYVLGFNRAGTAWYLSSSLDRETAALYRVDWASGQTELLFTHPNADFRSAIWDPVTVEPIAASAARLKPEWFPFTDAAKEDLGLITRTLGPEYAVADQTEDGRLWVVFSGAPEKPGIYHLFDRTNRTLTKLFETRPDLATHRLSPMHAQEVKARDGLSLTTYLTLPPDEKGAKPAKPLPLVLLVHGGPQARDGYGYHPQHQWLANRGYAVLSVNYRGSTGFGKSFVNAGNLEWARKMHFDLIDAVEWAIAGGIADRAKVAIMGGSYGGYATLVGLTFTPEVFACGVCYVGPSNLETLLATIPPYWTSGFETLVRRVGDPRTEEGRALLRERSPLWRANEIVRPLLIAHGANDPRVKLAESDQIVAAMQKNSKPVTYLVYPDEGHGFQRPENRMSFNAVTEAFLARHLGGRVEPIGADLVGSSLEARVGAADVPELAAALAARK